MGDAGIRGAPELEITDQNWTMRASAIPRRNYAVARSRIVGAVGSAATWCNDEQVLRDTVKKKARHYGELDRPFVLAVATLSPFLDTEDVMNALFGKEVYLLRPDQPHAEPRVIRRPDGAWRGPRGPQNTRVSALLLAKSLISWTAAQTNPCVLFNPWARHSVIDEFVRLPAFVPDGNELTERQGESAANIFGLHERWPESAG
jgi:hypothetical protein